MRTLMLIFNSPDARTAWEKLSPAEREADTERHRVWFRKYGSSVSGGEELGWPEEARILRRASGRIVVTDGPFAETNEYLGGFVLLDTPDMAAAERLAAEWPGVEQWNARVELRPISG